LLWLGVLINYFDRVNLSVSHHALTVDFGISDIAFGYLLGAYNWTYALCQLPVGVVIDKLGVRQVGRVGTLIWSLASFAGAIAHGFGGLFSARLLLGVGEAPVFPANAKAIGSWFPVKERSLATSLYDSAAKLAAAVGVPAIGILLLRVGWRLSFAVTGVVSLLYCFLFFLIYREPEQDTHLTAAEFVLIRAECGSRPYDRNDPDASLGYLLRQRKVLGLALGFGAYNYTFYLLLTWLPSYLSESLNVDLLHSFIYTGLPWIIAASTELLFGGWLVDMLIRRGWNANRVRLGLLVAGTSLGLGILATGTVHSAAAALTWISISNGGLAAASSVAWSIPALIAPRGSVGRLGGIINFWNQVSGIAAPVITGYFVYARHSFTAAFAMAGAYLIVGICAYLLLLRNIEQIAPEKPSQTRTGLIKGLH
jgi:MFS transporter, ACS family, D-galactonate transporter